MRLFLLTLLLITISSCKSDSNGSGPASDAERDELESKIEQLELDNALKDSVINESLSYFNEIKSNLEAISVRRDEIRSISNNPELTPDDKKWILEEIRRINFLREDNARKVKQLNEDVSKSGVKIRQLEIMIESLMKDIQWKDEQISLLQDELASIDRDYSAIFDAYQEQAVKIDYLTEELNKVYYTYGTEKELLRNKVIEKDNGFIGLGRSTSLKEDFNDSYFTKTDGSRTKTIVVEGKEVRLITDHPHKSYSIELSGNKTKIKISDPSEFWKISKYLVVVVE
jgi:DNA repair exonuclease SbcCD ATPase subunit